MQTHPSTVIVVPAPAVAPPISVATMAAQAADLHAQKADKIAGLKTAIGQLWANGKGSRVQTGHKLRLLQDVLATPGHGTFLQALQDLGIPRSTAYAYMAEAAGKDRQPSTTRKDELLHVRRKLAKAQLKPLRDNEDQLVAVLQKLLQATANTLLSCAGSGLPVTVTLQK